MAPDAPTGRTALLLLADGRFPAGGHVHSAGVEAAVGDGRVHDLASLTDFVTGRLHTAGLVDAGLAASTVVHLRSTDERSAHAAVLATLDREAAARIVAPPLRAASRRLGRQLLRVAARCWPTAVVDAAAALHPEGLHNPVALGAVAVAAGLGARDAASLSVHHTVTTPAQAAVRLLGLDPFDVAALTARVDHAATAVVDEAVTAAHTTLGSPAGLPAVSAPLVEIAALEHQAADLRLFAT